MITLEQARADIMTLSNKDVIDYVIECQALLAISNLTENNEIKKEG